MGNDDVEKTLYENLLPWRFQRRARNRFLFSPYHIGGFLAFTLVLLAGVVTRELARQPADHSAQIFAIRSLFYLAIAWLVYPATMRFCAVKRIPFFFNCFGIYLIIYLVYVLGFSDMSAYRSTPTKILGSANEIVIGAVFFYILSRIHGRMIARSLFANPDMYPVNGRYKPPKQRIYQKLSPEIISPITYMEQRGKGVLVVTERGQQKLEISLWQAISMIPKDQGFKIYRSVWVAKAAILAVRLENGYPRVRLRDGTELPADASALPKIKEYLQEQDRDNILPF